MSLFKSDTTYFGLDIGSTAIRFVQLKRGGANPVLVNYGQIAMPMGLAASDAAGDRDKVSELITQLLRDKKVTEKNVVVGLASNKIFASVITTPKLDNAELAKAIRFQAEQYIPMAFDQVKLDYAVVDQSKDGKNLEVLLVAAPTTVVTKYAEIIDKSGLEPLALEANAIAVSRSLVQAKDIAVVVLDISSIDSDITIISNQTPRLMRSVPVGGTTFVKAVAQELGLDEVQAGQFTAKFGLTQSKLEGQVYKAIKPDLDSLVGEIKKSVQFFNSRYPGQKLEKLVITGGTSAIPELAAYFATATGMPVEFGNAWAGVSYPSNLQDELANISRDFAAAVGLAQRSYRQ
jgi:type IV pilus assembly protein PilM